MSHTAKSDEERDTESSKRIIVNEKEFQLNARDFIKQVSDGKQLRVLGPDGKKIRSTIGMNGRRFFLNPEPDPNDEC